MKFSLLASSVDMRTEPVAKQLMRRHSFQGRLYLAHSFRETLQHAKCLHMQQGKNFYVHKYRNNIKILALLQNSTFTNAGNYLEQTNHKLSTAATAATSCYHICVYVPCPPPTFVAIDPSISPIPSLYWLAGACKY
jgi:hypothetical protein